MKHDESKDESGEFLDVSPEEAEEAAELARLLEGRSHVRVADEVMESVGLLRVMKHPDLSPESSAKVELEVLQTAAQQERTKVRPWWWVVLAGLVPVSALALFLLTAVPDRQAPGSTDALPLPPVGVLEAQASWITSDGARPRFEQEMRDYRGRVLAAAHTF